MASLFLVAFPKCLELSMLKKVAFPTPPILSFTLQVSELRQEGRARLFTCPQAFDQEINDDTAHLSTGEANHGGVCHQEVCA